MQHKKAVNSAAFSADGRRVVTASGDTAQVWEADTGKPVGAPLQHKDAVYSAAFSVDGRRVVTASGDLTTHDTTAQVWEVLLGSASPEDTALLADLAEAVAGYRINEFGSPVVLASDGRMELINKLRQAYNVPIHENILVWFLRRLSVSGPATKSAQSPHQPCSRHGSTKR